MSRTADRRLRVAVRCAVLIVTVAVATSATHDEFDTCQRHLSLEEARRELAARGASLQLLSPFGAEVTGLNLAALVRDGEQSSVHNRSGLASVLEAAMAHTGVLVFRGQGVLSGDDQVRISMLFGAGEMHSTHGEHAKAGNEHIFRLSNKDGEGIVGPGAEWHNDGSFAPDVFSHAGYHIVAIPEDSDAGTSFAHLGIVHDLFSDDERKLLRRMASVNSNGGVVHPLLYSHPISHRHTAFLHLAMTGAVVHVGDNGERTALTAVEMQSLFRRFHELCEQASLHHTYAPGDLIIIDNWAVAHRAREGSFDANRGLRVVHRTTVKGLHVLSPPPELQLPAEFPQVGYGGNGISPFPPRVFGSSAARQPVWVEGYVGFRWRPCVAADFLGTRPRAYVLMQMPCYDPADGKHDVGLSMSNDDAEAERGAWTRHLQRL